MVTDGVLGEAAAWQSRPLEPINAPPSAEAALAGLDAFAESEWGRKFPTWSRPGGGRGTG